MSIASEISRLQTAKAGLKTAIEGKGVTVSDTATLDAYPALVESIQTGGSGGSDDALKAMIERTTTSIDIPNGVTKIGDYAFYTWGTMGAAYKLTGVTIPDSVTSIGNYAFYECRNAVITSLPVNLKTVGDGAFCCAFKLTVSELPSGLTSIGSSGFDGTDIAITSLPSGLTKINGTAFRECSEITTLTIHSGIQSIGQYAFYNCGNLTTVTFEGTPTSMQSSIFNYCTNLKTINVPWSSGAVKNAPWGATNATINYNYTGA